MTNSRLAQDYCRANLAWSACARRERALLMIDPHFSSIIFHLGSDKDRLSTLLGLGFRAPCVLYWLYTPPIYQRVWHTPIVIQLVLKWKDRSVINTNVVCVHLCRSTEDFVPQILAVLRFFLIPTKAAVTHDQMRIENSTDRGLWPETPRPAPGSQPVSVSGG